jgi:hypothetical protein
MTYSPQKSQHPYLVIGAGASGLATARRLLEAGLPFEVVDRGATIGGLWDPNRPDSPVYDSLHMNTSRDLSGFPEFPMPESYPIYPSHRQALHYLQAFARHYRLLPHIRFHRTVVAVEPQAEGWRVSFENHPTRLYRGVFVASGFRALPCLPQVSGALSGNVIHSSAYKNPTRFVGRRVLVVGGGSSGCEIAAEIARANPQRTFWSLRRSYRIFPKFIQGVPADELGAKSARLPAPLWLRRALLDAVHRVIVPDVTRFGLPAPDHKLFESHPAIGIQVLDELAHGRLEYVGVLDGCNQHTAICRHPSKGTRPLEVDDIVFCTGYPKHVPFLSNPVVTASGAIDRSNFFGHLFHRQFPGLFLIGAVDFPGAGWPMADLQAQAAIGLIQLGAQGDRRAKRFLARAETAAADLSGGIRFLDTPRHTLEVDLTAYKKWIARVPRRRVTRPTHPSSR